MATYYKLVLRQNMAKDAIPGEKLWYAQAKAIGVSNMDRLCDLISDRSTVSSADVKAVLDSLVNVMQRELSDGKIVKLDDLGNFRVTFGSEGVESSTDFHASHIRKPKFTFTPGKGLRDLARILKFEKSPVEVRVEKETCLHESNG